MWLAVFGLFTVAGSGAPERDVDGNVTGAGHLTGDTTRVGDCVNVNEHEGHVDGVQAVPCAQPHQGEVYVVEELTGEFTNVGDMQRRTEQLCVVSFADYVGAAPEESRLGVVYIYPQDARGFDQNGRAVCLLVDPTSEEITGTLRGSGK